MSSGELHAWHYSHRRPIRLAWRDGTIVSIDETAERPAQNLWLAPPLVDLQINGYAGVDFQQDDLRGADLLRAARGLRRDGCTRWLLTLISDDWDRMLARMARAIELRKERGELEAAMIGVHLEGPFLSPEPGFCGAHDPARMIAATSDHLRRARALAGDVPLLLTIAPECPGAAELAGAAADDPRTFINAGHTNASVEQLRSIENGSIAFTHLGNGCPQLLDRHDNILWRALNLESLPVSLIPDGRHVSPDLFRIIHRLKGDRIHYTTDAMSAAGAPVPGQYSLGRLKLEVKEDGIVRFPGATNFAGSALTPIAGVFRAAAMLRREWQDTWPYFSVNAARRINTNASLAPGAPAEFCTLEFPMAGEQRGEWLRLRTHAAGGSEEQIIATPEILVPPGSPCRTSPR